MTVPHNAEGKLSELPVTIMMADCTNQFSTAGMQHGGHAQDSDAEQLLVPERGWTDCQGIVGETHG